MQIPGSSVTHADGSSVAADNEREAQCAQATQ
jgi:hypothetical protein